MSDREGGRDCQEVDDESYNIRKKSLNLRLRFSLICRNGLMYVPAGKLKTLQNQKKLVRKGCMRLRYVSNDGKWMTLTYPAPTIDLTKLNTSFGIVAVPPLSSAAEADPPR